MAGTALLLHAHRHWWRGRRDFQPAFAAADDTALTLLDTTEASVHALAPRAAAVWARLWPARGRVQRLRAVAAPRTTEPWWLGAGFARAADDGEVGSVDG